MKLALLNLISPIINLAAKYIGLLMFWRRGKKMGKLEAENKILQEQIDAVERANRAKRSVDHSNDAILSDPDNTR